MAQAQCKLQSGSAAFDDGMKGLLDLFSRSPTSARVTMHVERLLAGWREALNPDAYAERLGVGAGMLAGGLASAVRLLSFHAVQAQCRPPPSHSARPLPRHELAGI